VKCYISNTLYYGDIYLNVILCILHYFAGVYCNAMYIHRGKVYYIVCVTNITYNIYTYTCRFLKL